jgi:hypothetical protein
LNMYYLDIVKEEFSSKDQESAIKIVDAYDELEGDRVKRAIVCLASGSLDGLRYFLDAAKKDYRDVLYWSEKEEEAKDSSERALSEMTVNERLYHTGQLDAFGLAVQTGDTEVLCRILKNCFLSDENIDAIVKCSINT